MTLVSPVSCISPTKCVSSFLLLLFLTLCCNWGVNWVKVKVRAKQKKINKKQIAAPLFEWRAHFVVLGDCRRFGPQVPSAVTFTHTVWAQVGEK